MEKEIELLESVELRFALADTDPQLQKLLTAFLPPVLLKLDSPHEQVRNNVLSLLAHINKRIKPKPHIQIPLQPLLDLMENTDRGNFVKNFCLIYLEIGLERVDAEQAIILLPPLIRGISQRPTGQQNTLLQIILRILERFRPEEYERNAHPALNQPDPYHFGDQMKNASFLLESFLDVMLHTLPPRKEKTGIPDSTIPAVSPSTLPSPNVAAPNVGPLHVPPGLSPNAIKVITNDGKAAWASKGAELKSVKMGILRFIVSSKILPDTLPTSVLLFRFLILLAATCDSQHEVVGAGEDGLRRTKAPELEDQNTIDAMYRLYQGGARSNSVTGNGESHRLPSSQPLKLKIMHHLQRSKAAANTFPQMLQVIFDCLYGDTSSKLRLQGMAFVQWVARMADTEKIKPVASVILSGLTKFINEHQGKNGQEQEALQGFAYKAVGLLSMRVPELFRKDFAILRNFFEAIPIEPPNVRHSIQEALSTMVDAYRIPISQTDGGWSYEENLALESIFEAGVRMAEPAARFCAVKFATSLFPFSHPAARFICLLTASDERLEVREAARAGLVFPVATESTKTVQLPSFTAIVQMVQFRAKHKQPSHLSAQQGKRTIQGYTCETYMRILQFLKTLLAVEADPSLRSDDSEPGAEEGENPYDANTRKLLRDHLAVLLQDKTLSVYLELIEKGLNMDNGADAALQLVASSCLVQVVSFGPSSVAESYDVRVSWIKSFLSSIKYDTRVSMAHILSLVATSSLKQTGANEEISNLFEQLLVITNGNAKEFTVEHQHGAILALGYLTGRVLYREQNPGSLSPALQVAIQKSLDKIAQMLQHSTSLLASGACISVGEAGRYAPLPIPEKSVREDESSMDVDENTEGSLSKEVIVNRLLKVAKITKDVKTLEHAVATLAHLALGDPSVSSSVMAYFYSMAIESTKQVDVHFTVGEGIACITAGWECTVAQRYLDIADIPILKRADDGGALMKEVLAKIQKEFFPHAKVAVRKAACIWMLCIVKFAAGNDTVKSFLPQIYTAFSSLLAERDDFIQEVASRGVGLVYDLIDDPSVKRDLVQSLVGMFSEGKKLGEVRKVSAETQIFDSTTLGGTPDGSKIDTYQSILSLASDMNSPDLVYKFMQLASHNAIWQSRKGAAFGFASIIARAEAELQPHLTSLVPKLYRFQFDPNPQVNQAMSSIWRALVKEPKKAVEEQFDVIIVDLLKGVGDTLWRTREACCLALADLVAGRELVQLQPYLEKTWTMCFRALDDIKESVRLAAFKTCRALTSTTVKYCDPGMVDVKEGQKAIGIVLPFLLHKGLLSDAEDVRKFSLATILKICKNGGILLRPHVADVVGTLLEGLSTFEPQVMNYLSFHVEKHGITQDQLDASRLSATKMSPMMEGIEACVGQIDDDAMKDLVPRLANTMRKAVGLPTKAGCARFLATLALRRPAELRPHADSILRVLSGTLADRSPVVRKSYASAAGYIAHLASEETSRKFLEHVKKMYFENPDDPVRSVAGITVLEMTRHAQDSVKGMYAEVLPLAYFGMRDADEEVKSTWKNVWEDNTAGSTTAVKLYLQEILELSSRHLTSASWPVKRQAALTIADVVKVVEQGFGSYAESLIQSLKEALSGRTWEGKEAVLKAFVTVCVAYKDMIEKDMNEIVKILVRESNKNDRAYRRHALDEFGRFLDEFDVNVFDTVGDSLISVIREEWDDDDMDQEDAQARPVFLLLKASAIRCLSKAWPKDAGAQASSSVQVATTLSECCDRNVWNVRLAGLEALEGYVDKLNSAKGKGEQGAGIPSEAMDAVLKAILAGLEETKYTSIQEAGMRVLEKTVDGSASGRVCREGGGLERIRGVLVGMVEGRRVSGAMEEKAKEMIGKLKAPV